MSTKVCNIFVTFLNGMKQKELEADEKNRQQKPERNPMKKATRYLALIPKPVD